MKPIRLLSPRISIPVPEKQPLTRRNRTSGAPLRIGAALAAGLSLGTTAQAMPLSPDEIVVVDTSQRVLFRINPDTGERRLLAELGLCGATPRDAFRVAIEGSGTLLVLDNEAGTDRRGVLYRVDPVTGGCEVLSDFNVGAPLGGTPAGVAVEESGGILVVDFDAGTDQGGALVRVDPVSGARTLLTDFGLGSPLGRDPIGITVEESGTILVVDADAGVDFGGAVFRVDPASGARSLVADFDPIVAGGFIFEFPVDIAIEDSGGLLIPYKNSTVSPTAGGLLFRVDPVSGVRTLLTDFALGTPQGFDPIGVAVEDSGGILVVDRDVGSVNTQRGNGGLFRIDPVSGARGLVVDFGQDSPLGRDPAGVAVARRPGQKLCRALGDNSGTALDADRYTFQSRAGEEIRVLLRPNFGGATSGDRATLEVTEVISGVKLSYTNNGELPLRVTTTAPADGTYRITVTEKRPSATVFPFQGDYCLRLGHPSATLTPSANVEP